MGTFIAAVVSRAPPFMIMFAPKGDAEATFTLPPVIIASLVTDPLKVRLSALTAPTKLTLPVMAPEYSAPSVKFILTVPAEEVFHNVKAIVTNNDRLILSINFIFCSIDNKDVKYIAITIIYYIS
jgi:hypothetical protein